MSFQSSIPYRALPTKRRTTLAVNKPIIIQIKYFTKVKLLFIKAIRKTFCLNLNHFQTKCKFFFFFFETLRYKSHFKEPFFTFRDYFVQLFNFLKMRSGTEYTDRQAKLQSSCGTHKKENNIIQCSNVLMLLASNMAKTKILKIKIVFYKNIVFHWAVLNLRPGFECIKVRRLRSVSKWRI